MYRVVQTTGPDGKNLLKLLPISKSTGSFVPIVQSSTRPNNSKASISSPVHLTFETQLANTTAPSSVKIPIFPSPNSGKIILTRTLDSQERVRAGSEKESLIPKSAADTQSSRVSMDRLSVQSMAVTSSSNQHRAAYMLVNSDSLPLVVKSPALLSGHHLQIPADAEVKSVPASVLPPAVQQKILAAAATNMSRGADSTKPPTVIYVSPVNTVKTALPRHFQAICPKPTMETSKSVMTATHTESGSPQTATSVCPRTPVKWVVQESTQSSTSCLIPVKSSNNMASRILKTLSDMKNVEVNSANILPLSSSDPDGSQTKITPIKHNALVMYNGKVYLLTKRGLDVPTAQADKQAPSSSDTSLKKGSSKVIESAAVNKVTNLVLSKNGGMVVSQKDPNPGTNSNSSSPAGLRNELKPAPAALVTPSANQQDSGVNQEKSLPFTKSISSGVTHGPAVGTQENGCQNGEEKIHSFKAARALFPQPEQECASSEDRQKIQRDKMDSLVKVIQIEHREKPHWKQYLELRKKFGLSKEERVYLKRIPLRTSCEKPEERVGSSNSLERRNDSCSSSSLDVEINQHQECVKEEKIIVDLEENLTKKRKSKSSPLSDSGKRRKTFVTSTTNSNSEGTSSSATVVTSSVSPTPVSSQQGVPTDFVLSSPGSDFEQGLYPQYSDVTDSSVPVIVSCEGNASVLEGSFRDDAFLLTPPDLDETIRDERINRLKQLLREREAALEEMRRKMQQS
ncbi:ligand-dependent nuclear receptor-interacting factor 1 isoform X2 [Phaenicophaeus curvirostris]